MRLWLLIDEVWTVVAKLFTNFGLKFALWLPYMLTLLYFAIGILTLEIRYDIPSDELWYVMVGIIGYAALMEGSQYIRRKYWGLTKCKDL